MLFSIVVLLDVALTRIYVWFDFLMDMVIFWLQVVPPQKDKNPEVALEQLIVEQKIIHQSWNLYSISNKMLTLY